MDIQELIFSVIGLVIYWYLSNLGKKKNDKNKNRNINQETIIPPTNEGGLEQTEETKTYQREEVKAPSSFTDLLNILSDPGKIQSRQRDINPLDPQKSEERLLRDLDQYSPTNVAEETYESGMDQYYDDQDDYQWQDDFSNADLDKEKIEKGKSITKRRKPKKKKKVAQLFKSPNRIRDAFIMNEILMKKHE